MKKSVFTFGAVLALLLILGVGSSRAQNCEDVLGDNLYRCQFTNDSGGAGEACLQFDATPVVSSKFDLVTGGVTFGCTCTAKGSVDDPTFNGAREFLCVSSGVTIASAFEGAVNKDGTKIRRGFFGFSSGLSGVFECELDPTCP